jgi:hypothetical protein
MIGTVLNVLLATEYKGRHMNILGKLSTMSLAALNHGKAYNLERGMDSLGSRGILHGLLIIDHKSVRWLIENIAKSKDRLPIERRDSKKPSAVVKNDFGPGTQSILLYAAAAAFLNESDQIRPIHLLFGILQEGTCQAREILVSAGCDEVAIKRFAARAEKPPNDDQMYQHLFDLQELINLISEE